MNLVQKLPIGLSLACLMFMSSCSKEDGLTPEPQMESVNAHSSLRDGNGLELINPYLAATNGPTGFNVYPIDWERDITASNNILGLPTGTSSLERLMGNHPYNWDKLLPLIPSSPDFRSIVTFTSHASVNPQNIAASASKRSGVSTKIKNLSPGKLYKFTCYVASTICEKAQNGYTPGYADFIIATIVGSNTVNVIPMQGKQSVWVSKEVTFLAQGTEAVLKFTASTGSDAKFTYAHVFIDKNSIKKVQ